MKIVKLEKNIEAVLSNALEILKKGGIIAYPTETFYGLGAKYDIENSLKRLLQIKKRPQHKAIPLIIGNKNLLHLLTESVSNKAKILMNAFWPGPLTLIFKAKKNLSNYLTADTNKIAVRIPGESFALQLAKIANFPITATSANPSGFPPPCEVKTVIKYFENQIDLVIDSGFTPGGSPSTIVDVTEDELTIIREGMIKRKEILDQLK